MRFIAYPKPKRGQIAPPPFHVFPQRKAYCVALGAPGALPNW